MGQGWKVTGTRAHHGTNAILGWGHSELQQMPVEVPGLVAIDPGLPNVGEYSHSVKFGGEFFIEEHLIILLHTSASYRRCTLGHSYSALQCEVFGEQSKLLGHFPVYCNGERLTDFIEMLGYHPFNLTP